MSRRAATALHLALILLGAVLYVVFVLPRWWVLVGDVPATLATVGRLATAVPIGAAAIPVWLTLQRSMRPSLGTPELALRLRAWSAVLHVVAATLILLAAVTEIWLPLTTGGPWLFGVYGAAAAIVILAVAGFYLSFVAEQPPAPPKPPKPAKAKKPKAEKDSKKDVKKGKARGKQATDSKTPKDNTTSDESTQGGQPEQDESLAPDVECAENDTTAVEVADTVDAAAEAVEMDGTAAETTAADTPESPDPQSGALRNKRPTGKSRYRLRR